MPDGTGFERLIKIVEECSINDLWTLKGLCETKLVSCQKLTNNFVGERGVDLAMEVYNNTPGLPNLTRTFWANTKEVDLYSADFEGYSVKGLKGNNKVTSPFCGFLGEETEKLFDYAIIVRMNDIYQLQEIIEVDWETFKKFAKLNPRDKNYKLNLTNKLRQAAKVIYPANQASG